MSTVGITYRARMDLLMKDLEQVPNMTRLEVKKATAEIGKLIKEQEKAAAAAAKAAKQGAANANAQAAAQQAVKDATSKTAESASKLAGALNMVSPELGAIVTQGKAMADVFSVASAAGSASLAPALGAVGAAAAALGLVYLTLQGDIERTTLTMEIQADQAATVQSVYMDLERAQIAAAVASGEMSAADGRLATAQITLGEQTTAARDAQNEQRKAIESATLKAEKWLSGLDRATTALMVINPLLGAWTKLVVAGADEVVGLSDTIAEGAKQTAALDAGLAAQTDILTATAMANEEAARAIEARSAAEREAGKAAAGGRGGDVAAAEKAAATERERAAEQESRTLEQLASQIQTAQIARLEGAERIDAEARREIARLDEIAAAHQGNAEIIASVQAAQVEAVTTARDKLAALDAETEAREVEQRARSMEGLDALIAGTDEKIQAHKERQTEANAALIGGLTDLAGSASDALMGLAARQAEGNEKAARRTYAVAQGLAIADATIKTAQGVMAVLSTWAAFPPVAAGLAAAVGAMGAIQIGKIASTQPTLHTGGVFAPDEGSARLRRGEGVLTTDTVRSMGGARAIAETNRTRGANLREREITINWRDGVKGLTRTVSDQRRQRGVIQDLDSRTYLGRSWSR